MLTVRNRTSVPITMTGNEVIDPQDELEVADKDVHNVYSVVTDIGSCQIIVYYGRKSTEMFISHQDLKSRITAKRVEAPDQRGIVIEIVEI